MAAATKCGCANIYEIADYLEVTEMFLKEALLYYYETYGVFEVDGYKVFFSPEGFNVQLNA